MGTYTTSHIQILRVQRVFFDECAAGFYVVAHQCGEDFVGGDGVVDLDA